VIERIPGVSRDFEVTSTEATPHSIGCSSAFRLLSKLACVSSFAQTLPVSFPRMRDTRAQALVRPLRQACQIRLIALCREPVCTENFIRID
jgi:hypothetical protein